MTLYLNYNKFYILMILVRKTMFTKLKEDPRTEKGISNVNKGLNCTKDIISPWKLSFTVFGLSFIKFLFSPPPLNITDYMYSLSPLIFWILSDLSLWVTEVKNLFKSTPPFLLLTVKIRIQYESRSLGWLFKKGLESFVTGYRTTVETWSLTELVYVTRLTSPGHPV